jgi:hypothetical protein
MQGQLEVSVCVLCEEDMKEDPNLPIHIYDAEVEMWAELQNVSHKHVFRTKNRAGSLYGRSFDACSLRI